MKPGVACQLRGRDIVQTALRVRNFQVRAERVIESAVGPPLSHSRETRYVAGVN